MGHSRSPAVHNAAFQAAGLDWIYLAWPVRAANLSAAISAARAFDVAGLSVTMPHKSAIAGLLDRLDPLAATLGAVNTVVADGQELIGYNTDGAGLVDALRLDLGFDPAGRTCLVVGAGGAARAAVLALADAGAHRVLVLARRAAAGAAAAGLAGSVGSVAEPGEVASADLIVNATPLGMSDGDPTPVDPSGISAGQMVLDLIYHPANTALLAAAALRGAATANGLGVLVHQAARAFRIWTGQDPSIEAMRAAVGPW